MKVELLVLCMAVVLAFAGGDSAQAAWTVTQLTNNSYLDERPQIYGSNVENRRSSSISVLG